MKLSYTQALIVKEAKEKGEVFIASCFSPEIHALMRKGIIKPTKLEHGYYCVELVKKEEA